MNYFFDTSALIKRYIDEQGSTAVSNLMHQADIIYVSEITILECYSTLRRILVEQSITMEVYDYLKKEISYDFGFFSQVEVGEILGSCEVIIDLHQLKTLDSIQLSSTLSVLNEIDGFVCCDKKLINAAQQENLIVIDPFAISNKQ